MKKLVLAIVFLAFGATATSLCAGEVTNAVIFGDGVSNGSWTLDRSNGIELGLRGKVRFDATGQPQNTFNYDGIDTYTFQSGQPEVGGFGFAPGSSSTAKWSFEWSINSSFDGSGGNLNAYDYLLDIDFDPSAGTNFQSFDPINVSLADHAIGNNSTANGDGDIADDDDDYKDLIADNNLAQNSWNMEFFDDGSFPFNANQNGTYTFQLTAYEKGTSNVLASTSMIVNTVPEPTTILSFACIALLPLVRRRSRR
ncbi:hypothetical protein NHH03_22305 [Stieleria sp. TO1_6]|uniref:hypothetical protein n=1 Tax=Stieleria tagensis TaxID=2956795 RepID=UPI00209A655E|nr:hypothetical protein [Stieleria tagensis]MCO8124489.1 hypothetical protein [Stieleria tagensis]